MRMTVDPAEAGTRLDTLLAEPLGSRSRAARLIDAGAVRVDGRAEPKRYAVQAGETIEAVSSFLDHSSLAVTTVYLRRLEGDSDGAWPDVAAAIGL